MGARITLEMDSEDAKRLLDAFANGSLSELGISDIRIVPADKGTGSQWSEKQARSDPRNTPGKGFR
jgi:hypothetical protein